MTRTFVTGLLALLSITARAETLLQVDYGWRTDGEIGCAPGFIENVPTRQMACIDPIAAIEVFAQTMDTQFVSNRSCRSIILVRFPWGPSPLEQAAAILKRPHWMFFISGYQPGDEKQDWKLLDPKLELFSGKGSPKEIVQEVCGVVSATGGSLLR
jgi:hypothetical protein